MYFSENLLQIFIVLTALLLVMLIAFLFILKMQKNKFNSYIDKFQFQLESVLLDKKKLEQLNEELILKNEDLVHHKFELDKQNSLLNHKIDNLENKISQWEKMKDQSLEHAKAAIFDVAGKLSTKLIEDHKREAEQVNIKATEKFKETSTEFNKQFEMIVKSVSLLSEKVNESNSTVNIVKQALLSPSGSGALSEITLENILKSSGLVSGTDYFLQYNVIVGEEDNKILRPDAVIFLPGDNILVIDSKASKFFTEIEENRDDSLRKNLVGSMKNHVRSLASKNYRDAVKSYLKSNNSNVENVNFVSVIMFLPTESSLEKLTDYDKTFMQKAWENNIYPSGPVGLVNILSNAKFQVSQYNQFRNYNKIIEEVTGLIGNLSTLHDYARKVGNNLYSATSNFDKFAGAFNSKIAAKAKSLNKLGVLSDSNKIPKKIDRYQVISSNNLTLIEAQDSDSKEE